MLCINGRKKLTENKPEKYSSVTFCLSGFS